MKVEFYPSIEDYAHITKRAQERYKFPRSSQYAWQLFILTHIGAFAVFLWIYDLLLFAALLVAIDFVLVLFMVPMLIKHDYQSYFRAVYGNLDSKTIEVELTDEGIWSRSEGNATFYAWEDVTDIEETRNALFFWLRNTGIAVRKTGFPTEQEKNNFLEFARSRIGGSRLSTKGPTKQADWPEH
jgi:hypothetical protein